MRASSGPREVLQMTRSSHARSSPPGSKLYTFPPGEKTTFTAQAIRPSPRPAATRAPGAPTTDAPCQPVLCSRLLGSGDHPQSMEERLEREGRRDCQIQRSARIARGLEAARGKCFTPVCSIFHDLLAVVRVYQRAVGSERCSQHVAVPRDQRLDCRARLLHLCRARPALGERLALASNARRLGARRPLAERLDASGRLGLGGRARLAATGAAGVGDGAGGRTGVEALV